jgi:hypothetical protein
MTTHLCGRQLIRRWNQVGQGASGARDITAGGLKRPGLARYAVEGSPCKRNVKLVKQKDCLNMWGIEVRVGLAIKKGDEIFW